MRNLFSGAVAALSLAGAAQGATLFTASATAAGGPVKAYSTPGQHLTHAFTPFGADVKGANVGAGRNDDGRATLVVGAGRGGGGVQVYDVETGLKTHDFNPFDAGYTGGVRVAAGDVNGDGVADIVVGAGEGRSNVKVFDGATGLSLHSFEAFEPTFLGGVSVAVGDVNGDGRADVIVGAGAGGGPHVKVFDGVTGAALHSFFAFDPTFTGGVNVAAGHNALGATIIVGQATGGGHVTVFDTTAALIDSFLAFGPDYLGGVAVGGGSYGRLDSIFVGALDGPGVVDIYAADRRGTPRASLRAFDGGGVNVAGVFAVPEPGAWALMILGFGLAGALLRRRPVAA